MIGTLTKEFRDIVYPLTGAIADYDPLMEAIGDARLVLIGEASHGTDEFYCERAEITKRLIQEKGFTAIAVEADFPDAYRVNRFVQNNRSQDLTAEAALRGFQRFPMWMWRNTAVLKFINWLRQHNDELPTHSPKVGFYGLDLYSMNASIDEVLKYLDKVDSEAAARARHRYACFDHFGEDGQEYGYEATFGLTDSCKESVINQLLELQGHTTKYAQGDEQLAEDEFFYAEQNARLVKNAEEYYRSMFDGQVSSWNIRDRHMAETLDSLVAHLARSGNPTKTVVWAHNSHLGDARATEMSQAGEWNVGQLVRERYGQEAFLLGFSTYIGTVTAATHWGELPQLKRIRPALPESYEAMFHSAGIPRFFVDLREDHRAIADLRERRLERAIGVIYRPETERLSHYFYAQLPEQFDAIIHIDDTRAVEPLDRTSHLEPKAVPDTYPSSL